MRSWTLFTVMLLAFFALSGNALAQQKKKVDPCNTPDEGFGVYDPWDTSISKGQMLAPQMGGVTKDGGFDLIVHFHGHEPIRKEFAPVGGGIVLVGIDLGVRSVPYLNAFSSADVFIRLLDSVKKAIAKKRGLKRAYVRRIGLSSWSAGYGAIDQILRQPIARKIDTVILLDSLYGAFTDSTQKEIKEKPLSPFLKFAKDAIKGRTFLYQTHSSVLTHGYANTRQVSHFMVKKLGGKMQKAKRRDRLGLELFERHDRRGYRVRGYKGDDKPAHCAHIGIMRDVVKTYTRRRWKTPRGYARKIRK